MSVFLNTRGRASLGIAICARCARKFPIGELMSDPNAPGLKVCAADRDDVDPYTLSPRMPEDITLRFVRKDVDIAIVDGSTPTPPPGSGGVDSGGGSLYDDNGNPMLLDDGPLA